MSDAMNGAIDYLLETAAAEKLNAEILATRNQSTSISFQQRKLDKFQLSETQQIGVRVIDGQHEGVAYSESLERDALDQMLAAARENARMITKEFIAELRAADTLPTMDAIYNPALEDVTMERKIAAASKLEATVLDYDKGIKGTSWSGYSDSSSMVWIANTKGLRGSYRQNYCAAFTAPLAADGEGAVQHGEAEACRSFEKLNTEEIAKTAARITLSRRGAVRPRTGTYTVVFENRAAERLIGLTLGYFSAKAVDENRSPLKGKLGQAVFSKNLSLLDDPFFTSGTGCRPFDEEGYPARKTTLVENGTLKNFLTNSVYARKMNLPHTASASRSPSTDLGVSTSNVLVRPGTQTLEELLASDAKVILVTDMLGFAGFRSVSGDFSLPMEGFLYENGKMSRPLKDFLISGNILNVLGAVDAVGNDTRNPVSGVVSPSLLVRGLNVAGQS